MASSKSLRFNLDCCLKKGGQQKDLNILKMHIAAVLRMTMNLYIHNINSQGGLHKYYIFIIGVVRGGGTSPISYIQNSCSCFLCLF